MTQEINTPHKDFGNLLRAARKKACLTQEELGRRIGLTGNAIVQYERGRAKPRHKAFTLLIKELGLPSSYFIKENYDQEKRSLFSERLKQSRKELNLTQEELGNKIGVSGKSIAQYEAGRAYPRQGTFSLLVQELGVSSSYLLTGNLVEEKIKAQTKYEKSALEILREIDPKEQRLLLDIMRVFSASSKKKNEDN